MIEEFPGQPPNTEFEIEELMYKLKALEEIYPTLSPELQEEWWHIEQGAKHAEDRKATREHLENFLAKIEAAGDRKLAA